MNRKTYYVVCRAMTIIWYIMSLVFMFEHHLERGLLAIVIAMLWTLSVREET